MYSLLIIPLAYLIGSISSTCIISHLSNSFNPKSASDGRISAAAVYRKMGRFPFVITVIMDIGVAALAVGVAKILTASAEIQLAAGLAAVTGHNWSVFLKFKGGLGATSIAGVLLCFVPIQFLSGLVVAGIIFVIIRRPGLSTLIAIAATSSILFIQNAPVSLSVYPVTLFLLMLIKRWQADGAAKLAHWDRNESPPSEPG